MNILLVEDHPLFRLGLRQAVQARWPLARVDEAATLAEAEHRVGRAPDAIAIVDLRLPDAEGIEAVPRLLAAAPDLRMLVMSFHSEASYAERVLGLGARGYLSKGGSAEELLTALELVGAGGRYVSPALARRLAERVVGRRPQAAHEALSDQETRVMLLIAAGKGVGEIAGLLGITGKSVTTYRARLLRKLALDSNVDVAKYCLAHGLSAA